MSAHDAAINILLNARAENETFRVAALRADPESSEVFYKQNEERINAAIDALRFDAAVSAAVTWDGSKAHRAGSMVVHDGKLWSVQRHIHNSSFEPGKMWGAFKEVRLAPIQRLADAEARGYSAGFSGGLDENPHLDDREMSDAFTRGLTRARSESVRAPSEA